MASWTEAPAARLPLTGVTLSHVSPACMRGVAVQSRAAVPELVSVTCWKTGFGPTSGALKVSAVGSRLIVARSLTLNATSKVSVETPSVTVTVAVYVPAARPVGFVPWLTETSSGMDSPAFKEPAEGLTVSQAPPTGTVTEDRVQVRVPLPPFVRPICCGAGTAGVGTPADAAAPSKLRLFGDRT